MYLPKHLVANAYFDSLMSGLIDFKMSSPVMAAKEFRPDDTVLQELQKQVSEEIVRIPDTETEKKTLKM